MGALIGGMGLLVGFILGGFALLGWQQLKKRNRMNLAVKRFRDAVKNDQIDRLFVFNAQELLPNGQEQGRLIALFANRHNLELVEFWIKSRRLLSLSLEENDPRDPIHRTGVIIAIAEERKLAERDGRRSKRGTRNRHHVEPDNVLGSLQAALGDRGELEDLAEGLVGRYTMIANNARRRDSQPEPRVREVTSTRQGPPSIIVEDAISCPQCGQAHDPFSTSCP